MKPIEKSQRHVVNIHDSAYSPFIVEGVPTQGTSYIQLELSKPPGAGFTIFKMDPGAVTRPHTHTCDEQFLVLEGEMIDNDGTVYRPGDFVLLEKGTQHNSHAPKGCLLAVYVDSLEDNLES